MQYIFLLARLYPYWTIPVVLLCYELGLFLRNRDNKLFYVFWIYGGFLGITLLLWIYFRGDLYSDDWVKAILSSKAYENLTIHGLHFE